MKIKSLLILSILLVFVYAAHAQAVQELDVTVNDVNGDIEIMLPNTSKWVSVPVEPGIIFSEGTQIRTGPFSSISLVFADSSVVIVDSFTYMTIEKFFRSGNVVTTRLNLIIGAIVNSLNEKTHYENDHKIITPSFVTSLSNGELKKIVSGAMYKDTVKTGYKRNEDEESAVGEGAGYRKKENAGKIAQAQHTKRESSSTAPQ